MALVSYLSTSRDVGVSCCCSVAYSAVSVSVFVSVHSKKYVGGQEVQLQPFLTTDYMDVRGQFHSLAGLPPGS